MSDALSELLRVCGVRGALISRARLSPPFGVSTLGMSGPIFHTPLRGHCLISDGGEHHALSPGDLAVLPHGAGHTIADKPQTPCRSIRSFDRETGQTQLPTVTDGSPDPALDLVCGSFQLGTAAREALMTPLPPLFIVRGNRGSTPFIQATLALLEQELGTTTAGSELVSDRLVELLVVHLLRAWASQQPAGAQGWLAGLQDPRLGPVLTAIHASPSQSWSLERMARHAGMSRTRFVHHFQTRVGMAPGQWMTRWRVAVGQRALRDGADLVTAAERAGYSSEASFSRAFKRVEGVSPGAWRRRAQPQ